MMKVRFLAIFLFLSLASFGQVNEVDSQGRKQGAWQKAYKGSRVLQYKGQFKNDKPVGKFIYYYKSSKVKAIIKHTEGSPRSVAYYYHENGAFMSSGIFIDQKKDSIWVNFGPSQRLSSTETYANGLLNGKKIVYYVPADIHNKNQIPSGVYMYVNGEKDGKFTEYFDNLVVMATGQYSKNKKVGVWYRYHPTGKKMTLTRYKNGTRHGWCVAYDKNGKELNKEYYYYGENFKGARLKAKMKHLKEKGINPNE